jgi:hypothetical protein
MSYAGEVCGGGFRVLVKRDDGRSFPSDWLPNNFRFASEEEAKHFVKHLCETWVPAGFIRATQTVRSKDLVNARWDERKREAVLLPVSSTNVPAAAPMAVEEDYEEETPHPLVDETRYRSRKKLPKRRFSRELYRAYRDETKWRDREQEFEVPLNFTPKGYGVLSDAIRHDLRHLILHGHGRLELSQRLFGFFRDAHEGKAPENMLDLTRWMATPDAHIAYIGWYSFGEWRGPAQTLKDLIAALDIEDAEHKLDLEELEKAEHKLRMARSKNVLTRLELFESRLTTDPKLKKPQTPKQQRLEKEYEASAAGKCKLPDLQKFAARHGGDCSRISIEAWDRFNQEIENWKTCIQCDDHWSDPNWRQWYVKKTIEIWGDS